MSGLRGDTHNFGRRVTATRKRVHKPRTVFWEWLLLSRDSPLRRWFDEAAPGMFAFLPSLKFYKTEGDVERITLSPLRAPSTHTLSAIAGRSLALWSWLGVSDLHWENLALGLDARGNIVFGPLDVEMILGDLSLPTETKLLPDADSEVAAICRHSSGVRRLLPYLEKPISVSSLLTMIANYRNTLELLDHRSRDIARVLLGLPGLRNAPIRVMLRGTDEYVRARSEPVWPPLLDAEAEQMARGDIPYFFRLYGVAGIHYYGDRALTKHERIPRRGDVPTLDPILSLSRGLRSPSRKRLREEGLFAILGAFDHESFTGTHKSDELTLTLGARTVALKLPSGEELRSPRNRRALVGSVYLPCSCGEVRSVLVPSITTCVQARGTRDTAKSSDRVV